MDIEASMKKVPIELVIIDLDNTLYDWVTFFASAFYAMISVAADILKVPENILLDECKVVHQRHHDSEAAFSLLETSTVTQRYGHLSRSDQAKALDAAFHAFNSERDRTLKLYPSVQETLSYLKQRITVVAHTEASAVNALFRLTKLGVVDSIDVLYALEHTGQGHPDPLRMEEYRKLLENIDRVRTLRQDERKPNPQVVLDICKDQGISPERTLYIGDSLSRDIGMAKAAGAWAAWAKYGTSYDATHWDRLVRITHWTPTDVERAQRVQEQYGDSRPDRVLAEGLGDVLQVPSDPRQANFVFSRRGSY
jgi:FMN phosphatase YigB (HAD superfamily)